MTGDVEYRVVNTDGPLVALGSDGTVMIAKGNEGEETTTTFYTFSGGGWCGRTLDADCRLKGKA